VYLAAILPAAWGSTSRGRSGDACRDGDRPPDPSGAEAGVYRPASSNSNPGDHFQAARKGLYSYSLKTAGLSNGTLTLRVSANDGTHTTSITLK
jgi:hypothetical protein